MLPTSLRPALDVHTSAVLDQLRTQLRALALGPDVEAILAMDVPAAVVPLLTLVDTVPPDVLDHLVVVRLLHETRPGGALDPQQLGSDLPWARVVAVLLAHDPAIARVTAWRWWQRVDRLGLDDAHVGHAVVVAVAAYSMSAAEEALGRPVQARRWAREADAHVECEGPGVSVATWVRAQVLLGKALTFQDHYVFWVPSVCPEPSLRRRSGT